MQSDALLSLTEDQLRRLAEVLRTVLPCGQGSLRRAIAERVKVKNKEASEIIRSLGDYLLKAIPGGPLEGRVWDKFVEDSQLRVSQERLTALHAHKDIYQSILSEGNAIALKGAMLQQRILPHVASFETVVDLRPVFDDSHMSVLAFVPVIILQLNLHNDSCDAFASHSFQLSPDALAMMLTTLEDARDKLSVISASLANFEPKVLE